VLSDALALPDARPVGGEYNDPVYSAAERLSIVDCQQDRRLYTQPTNSRRRVTASRHRTVTVTSPPPAIEASRVNSHYRYDY